MLIYLLKSGACLAIFMAFYTFFLEKENMLVFKRFYLLGALIIAFAIPLITFTQYIEVPALPMAKETFAPVAFYTDHSPQIEETNYLPFIFWSIYALGVLVFGSLFIKNLNQIVFKIKRNPKQKSKHVIHVLLNDLVTPHTFFNYIFLNRQKFEKHEIPKEIFWHEESHAKQKHSIDVLFIELLQVIFWFNPLIYFVKHAIKMNLEFLADQAVLNKGISLPTYQHILLAFSSPDCYRDASESPLANAINYSSNRHAAGVIKKRFTVMKTHTTKRKTWILSILLLPILALLIYSFSESEIIEKEVASMSTVVIQDTEIGATEAMMTEYKSIIDDIEFTHTIWTPKINRAAAIYDIMTEAQRITVKKYPENPVINLATVKPKTPSETLFDSWKNKVEFAIWIDGKHVSNETLKDYKASDFKYYTSSFVYNNARSKKFPQPYQNHLYTKTGFEDNYLKSNVNKYNRLKNEYLKTENAFINSNEKDDSELRILKAQLAKVYNSISENEIERYDVKLSTTFQTEQSQNLKSYLLERDKTITLLDNPKAYPGSFLEMSDGDQRIFQAQYMKMHRAYSKLTELEKKSAPKMLPPAPDPKGYILKNGKIIKKNQ